MKSAKTMVFLACVVVLALCLGIYSEEQESPRPERTTRTSTKIIRTPPRRPKPPEDPYKDSVVMLEAYMVQARLSALYSLDVPVISQGCKTVSAEHILKLLKDTDAAQVTAGAKLTFTQSSRSTAKTESTARQGTYASPSGKGRIEYVEVGTSFSAVAYIQPEGKISVTLDFKHSSREQSDVDSDIAPPFVERSWSTRVYLEPGKPTLVGATQDKKTAAFLIITANIKE